MPDVEIIKRQDIPIKIFEIRSREEIDKTGYYIGDIILGRVVNFGDIADRFSIKKPIDYNNNLEAFKFFRLAQQIGPKYNIPYIVPFNHFYKILEILLHLNTPEI